VQHLTGTKTAAGPNLRPQQTDLNIVNSCQQTRAAASDREKQQLLRWLLLLQLLLLLLRLDSACELGQHSQDADDDNNDEEVVVAHGLQPGSQGGKQGRQGKGLSSARSLG
jgi:hypothetical protein